MEERNSWLKGQVTEYRGITAKIARVTTIIGLSP